MLAKIVIAGTALGMVLLCFSPLRFALFYLIVRPMLGPIALEHQALFGGIPLTGVLPALLIAYSLVSTLLKKGATFLPPAAIPLYVLLLATCLSFYNTLSFSLSFAAFLKLLTAPACYLLIYNALDSRKQVRSALYGCVLASLVPMAVGYYQYLTNPRARGAVVLLADRISGTLNFPNAYGEFLAISLFACMMLLLQEKQGKRRVFLVLATLSNLVSTVIALNRGSWIALAIAFMVAYAVFPKRIKLRYAVIALLLVSVLFAGKIASRFTELKDTKAHHTVEVAPNTFNQRLGLWLGALKLVPRHPVAGWGLGTAELINERYYRDADPPHNDYVRILLECGALGLLCFISFVVTLIFKAFQLRRYPDEWFITMPLFGLVIYWAVISFVQNVITDVVNFPFFLCMVALAMKWKVLSEREGKLGHENIGETEFSGIHRRSPKIGNHAPAIDAQCPFEGRDTGGGNLPHAGHQARSCKQTPCLSRK